MSKTLSNAQDYIAKIVGGTGSPSILTQATDALAEAMEDFVHANNWSFLLQDTSQTETIVCSAVTGQAVMTTAVSNGFKDLLVGQTVTGTSVPASTTILSIESNTSLTLSADTTGTITTANIVFGGTIPIIQGTDTYKLRAKFWRPYDCRLTSSVFRPLSYLRQNQWDSITLDQTIQQSVVAYTIYNSADFDASGTQQTNIRFFGVPNQVDVALLKYYRALDVTLDPIDILDEYEFTLLKMAQVRLLMQKNARDSRIPILIRDTETRLAKAVAIDRESGGDDQMDRFITPNERSHHGAASGQFFPHSDVGGYWGY